MQARDPADLIEEVITLARHAGRKILDVYDSHFDVDLKNDRSPLTQADLASHRCLVAGLQSLNPAYPLVSEESAEIPFSQRRQWTTYWLIDPLDGTKEFIKRNGEFTVNVALIDAHRPVLGVVYVPVRERCYHAVRGSGAFRRDGGAAPQAIRVRASARDPVRVVGSRSHGTPDMDAYLERLGAHELITIGSSLKFCLVAEGTADLYPRLGPTSEWDTAAAHCVVEQAGGRVADLGGAPLRYNTKASCLNPSFLVYGDTSRDWTAYAGGSSP